MGVQYSSDLVLDGSAATIINDDSRLGLNYNMTWTWICPMCFNCQGMTWDNDKKLIFRNISLASTCGDWAYLKSFDFTLQVRTGFVGLNGSAFIQRKFGVTWLGPPPNVEINYPKVNSINQPVLIEIVEADWLQFVDIYWYLEGTDQTTNGAVTQLYANKDSYLLNADRRRQFQIAADSFSSMGTYRFRLKLFSSEFKEVLVYETDQTFFIAGGPHSGSFSIDRLEGPALLYEFTLSNEGWQSYVQPSTLKFQYFYRNEADKELRPLSEEVEDLSLIKSKMPETKLVYLHVTDALGGITKRGIYVRIYIDEDLINSQNVKQSIENQVSKIDENKVIEGLNELQAWTETISQFKGKFSKSELDETSSQSLDVV